MFAMFAIFKIIGVLLRNQLVLKPAAWPAARAVKRHVQSVGLEPRSVQLWLGLAPPNNLHLLVVFKSDAELASFWCETSPAGATQESPGRKPWEQGQ